MRKALLMICILAMVVALPFIFRRPAEKLQPAKRQLVVISAHNEAIRYEVELAFREYHRRTHNGEEVSIDWRNIGGSSEIMRYIRSTFTANFQHAWRQNHPDGEWDDALASAVFSPATDRGGTPAQRAARAEFLAGNVGVDIDILFGGGQYDFNSLAQAGLLVPCGVRRRHPEWFDGPDAPFLPGGGGEIWYDPQDRYYAACFSCFGIIFNRDRLAQAGFSPEEVERFGTSWRDLADPRLYRAIGIADPTQSGSINKCFEMIIQREMQDALKGVASPSPEQLDAAWRRAMALLKVLGGNAAYLTFSASKVPVDAATGQIAAGMCIDFYGRSQVEWEKAHVGRETITYRTPRAASTVSGDPIGMLRGARDPELAQEFIDFVLSPEGQRLWAGRVGTPGGPRRYNLYRLPCRRDLYTPAERANMCIDAEERPFELAEEFRYQGAWTSRLFNIMRLLIKVMIIDCGPELRAEWKRILDRGGLEKLSPAQRDAFHDLPFEHHDALQTGKALSTPEQQATAIRRWIDFFRTRYRTAGSPP